MNKTPLFDCLLGNKNDPSSVDKSLHHQYLQSLERGTNVSSQILLDASWQKHTEVFNSRVLPLISGCMHDLLKDSKTNEGRTQTSNARNFENAIALFEKSIPSCEKCTTTPINLGFEKLLKNNCQCHLNITKESDWNKYKNTDEKKPLKPIAKQNSTDFPPNEESRPVFAPRFSKSKQKNIMANNDEAVFVENEVEEERKAHNSSVAKITFKTAREQLLGSNPAVKRSLGASRKAQNKFVSPMIGAQEKQESSEPVVTDDRLKHIDPKMIELIESEIIDKGAPVAWEDIAGLQMAKSVIQEAVVWPLLRPDIFTGLRRPPKGILLFGPPGTGKTLIGKCVAAQCNATFFSISASSLTSKWIGDGEKMVRALFAVARCHQPAVIFIDEIDSLLTQRSDSEHEATRRIKTEFLVQFDGAATAEEDRILIVGATNRPQELDEAARRRLVKRLYIPLPDADARRQITARLLEPERHTLSASDIDEVSRRTEGYSGADMKSLCSEAAMGPIRAVPMAQIVSISRDSVRPVCVQDFFNALQRVRPSVSQDDLGQYVKWNKTYGQGF